MSNNLILSVSELSISFGRKNKWEEVIHTISFNVSENEVLGIVGESGSGKSVTSMAMMGLLPPQNSKVSGQILFDGKNLLSESNKALRKVR